MGLADVVVQHGTGHPAFLDQLDGLFQSDEEAQAYAQQINLGYVQARVPGSKWAGGDPKYIDLDGDGKIGIGENSVDNPGDRRIIGNSTPRYNYGPTLGFDYAGFDFSMFFQGVGKRQYYFPSTNWAFWGLYSQPMLTYLQKGLYESAWTPENKDAYFPRPVAYYAYTSGAPLYYANTRYLQNVSYLRLKNLSVGYSLPQKVLAGSKFVKRASLSFVARNLLVFYCPAPYDTDASMSAGSGSQGVDYYGVPGTRSFGFNLKLGF